MITENEIIIDGKKESVVKVSKRVNRSAWWRIWNFDLFAILGFLDSKQFEIFSYIMENVNPVDNTFIGTYESISKAVGVSSKTVARLIPKLVKSDFMIKLQNGVYRINPAIMMMGKDKKRYMLIDYYVNEKGIDDRDKDKAKIEYATNTFKIENKESKDG